MKVQKNYGDLTIYVKNGMTKHIYPLKRGQTNIGGNVDSDIRLKHASEVVCTIDVNEDGIATISNNSDGIQINGSIVRDKKILKNDDEIEIMGKKVVYRNSGLVDENISAIKKFRRQTEILASKPRATPKAKKTPLSPRNQRAQTERKVSFSTATHNKIVSKRRLSLRTPEIKAVKSRNSKPLPSPLNKSTPKRNRSSSTPATDKYDDSCIYISSDSFQTQSIEDLTTPLPEKQKSFRSTFHTVKSSSTVSTPISEPFKTPLNTPSLFENIRKSAMKSRSRHYKSSSSFMEHIGSSFEAENTSTLVVTRSHSTIHQKSLLKDFESESPITNSSRRQSKSDLLVDTETNQNLINLNDSTIPSDTELNNATGIDMKRLIHFSSTPKHSLSDKMSLTNRRSFSIKRLNINRSSISNLTKSLPTKKSILKEKAVLIKQDLEKSLDKKLSNSRFIKKNRSFSRSNDNAYDSDKETEKSHGLSLRRSRSFVKNTKSFNAHVDEDKDPIPEKKVRISRSMIVNQSEDIHNSDEEADHYYTKSVNDSSDIKMLSRRQSLIHTPLSRSSGNINKSVDNDKNFNDESYQSDEDSDTSYVKKFVTVRASNLKAIKKSPNTKITRKSLSSRRSTASINTHVTEKSMPGDKKLRQSENKRSMNRSQSEDSYYSDEEVNQLPNSDVQYNQTNFESGTTPKRQSISSMDKSLLYRRSTARINRSIVENSVLSPNKNLSVSRTTASNQEQYEDPYHSSEETSQSYAKQNSARKSNLNKSNTSTRRQSKTDMDKSRSTLNINQSDIEQVLGSSPDKNLSVSRSKSQYLDVPSDEDIEHYDEEVTQQNRRSNLIASTRKDLDKSGTNKRQSRLDMNESGRSTKINKSIVENSERQSPSKNVSLSRSMGLKQNFNQLNDGENSDEEANESGETDMKNRSLPLRRSTAKINRSIAKNSLLLDEDLTQSPDRSMLEENQYDHSYAKDSVSVRRSNIKSSQNSPVRSRQSILTKPLSPRRSIRMINLSIENSEPVNSSNTKLSISRRTENNGDYDHSTNDEETGQFYNLSARSNITASKESAGTDLNKSNTTHRRQSRADMDKSTAKINKKSLPYEDLPKKRQSMKVVNKTLSPRKSFEMINKSVEKNQDLNQSGNDIQYEEDSYYSDENTDQYDSDSVRRPNVEISNESAVTKLNKSNTTNKRQSLAGVSRNSIQIDEEIEQSSTIKEKSLIGEEKLRLTPNKKLSPKKSIGMINKSVERNQDLNQTDNDIQYEEDCYYFDENTDRYESVSVRRSNIEISNESVVSKLNKSNTTNKRQSLPSTSKNVSRNSIQTDEEIDQSSNKYDDDQVNTEQDSVSVRRSNVKSPASNLNRSATRNTRQSVADMNKSLSTRKSTIKEKFPIDEEELRQSPNKKLSPRKSIGMMNKSVERNEDLNQTDNDIQYEEDSYYSDEETDQYESVSVGRKSNTTTKRQSLAGTSKNVSRNSIQTDEEIDQSSNKYDDDQVHTEQDSVSVRRSNVKSPASNLNKSATRNTRQSVADMNKSLSTRKSTIKEKFPIDEEELRQSPNKKLSPRKSIGMINKSVERNQDLNQTDNDIQYEEDSYYSDEETDQYESVSVGRKSNTTTKRQSLAGTSKNVSRNSIQTDEEIDQSSNKYDDDQVHTEQDSVSVRQSNVKSPASNLNKSATRNTRQSVADMNKSLSTRKSTIKEKSPIDEEELRQSPNKKLSPRKSIGMMNKSVERNQDLIHSDNEIKYDEDSYYSDENTDQYDSVSVRRSNIEISNESVVTKLNKSNTTTKRQSLAGISKNVSRNSIQTDEEIDQISSKYADDQVHTEQESVSVRRSNVKSPASNLNKSVTDMNKSSSTRRSTFKEKSLIDEELRRSPNKKLSPRKSIGMINKSVERNQDLNQTDNDIQYEEDSYYSDEETDQYESVSVGRKSNTTTKRQSLAGTSKNVSRNSIQTDEEIGQSSNKYDDDKVDTEQESVSVILSNVKSPASNLNKSATRNTRQSVADINKSLSTRTSTIKEKSLIDEEQLRQSPNKKLSPRKSIGMMNKSVERNQDLIHSDNEIQYEEDSYYSDEETDQYESVSVGRKSNTTTKRQSLAGTSKNVSRNSIQTDEEIDQSSNKYDDDQVNTEQDSVSVRRSNVKSPASNLNKSATRNTRQSVADMNKSLSTRRSTIKEKSLIDEEELRQSPNKKLSISSSTNKIQNFDQPITEDQYSDVSDEEVNQSYTKQESTALRRSNIKSPFKKSNDSNVTSPSQSMAHMNKSLSSRRSTAKLNRSDVANSVLAEEELGQKLSNSRSNKVNRDFDQFDNEDPHDDDSDEEVNQSYKNTSLRRSNVKSPASNLNKSLSTRKSATNTNTSINKSPNKSISRSSKKNPDFQQCDNDDQYGNDTYHEEANQSNTKQGSLSLRRSTMMSPVRKLNKSNVTTSPHSMNKSLSSRKNTAKMYKSDIENSLLAVEDLDQNPIKNLSISSSLVNNAEDLYQSIDGNELEENQDLVSIRRSSSKQLSFQKINTPKRQSNIKKTPVKEENIVSTSARKSSVKKPVGDNSVFMDKKLSTSRSVRQSGNSVFTSEDDEDEINKSYSHRKLETTNSTFDENNQDNDYTSEDEVNETDSEIDQSQPKAISMDQDYEQSDNDDEEYYEERSSYEDDTENTTNNQSSNNQNLSFKPNRVTDFRGFREMLQSPKNNRKSDYRGVREMLQSPPNKARKSDYRGVREMLQSPPNKGRKSDYRGVREMLQSPKNKGRRSDYRGVRELMASPKENDCSYYLEDVSLFNTENSDDLFDKIFDKKPVKTYKGKSMSPQKIIDLSGVPRKSNGDVPVVSPRVNEWVEEHMKVRKNMESTAKGGRNKAVPLQCSSITSSERIESRKGRKQKTNTEVSDQIEEDIKKDLPKPVRRRNISVKETESKEQEDVVKESRKRKNGGSDDKTQKKIKVAKETKKSRTEIVDSFSEVKENIESLDEDTNDPPKRVTRKKHDNVKVKNKTSKEDTELKGPLKSKKQEQNEIAVVSNNPPMRITRKRGNAMQKSLSIEEIITIEDTRSGRKNVASNQKTDTDTTESKKEQTEIEEVTIVPPKRTRRKRGDAKQESPTRVKETTQNLNQSSENASEIITVDKIITAEDTPKPRRGRKQAASKKTNTVTIESKQDQNAIKDIKTVEETITAEDTPKPRRGRKQATSKPKIDTETTESKQEQNKMEEVTNDPPTRTMRKRGDAKQDSTKVKETTQNLNQSSENASEMNTVDKIITAEDTPKPRRGRKQATSKQKTNTGTIESRQDQHEIKDIKTVEETITVEDTPKLRRGRKQATSKPKIDTETTESKQEQNKMEEVTNDPPTRTMRKRGDAKQDSTKVKETTQNLNQSSENASEINNVDKIITAEDTPKPRRGRKQATSKQKTDTGTTESKQDQNEIKDIKTVDEAITVEDTPKLRRGRKQATSKPKIDTETPESKQDQNEIKEIKTVEETITVEDTPKPRRGRKQATSKQKTDTETTGSKEEQNEIKEVSIDAPKRTYRKRGNAKQDSTKVTETPQTPNQIGERLSEIKTTEEIITVENISKPRRGRKNVVSKQKTDTDITESKQEQTEIQQLTNTPPKRTTRNRGNAKQDSIKVTETGTVQEVETEESAKPQKGRKRKGDDHNIDTPKQQKTILRTRREKIKVDI